MTFASHEELEYQVMMLHRDRMSSRAIARALKMGRNRVKRILAAHQEARAQPHCALPATPVRSPRPSRLDKYRARVQQLLEQYEDITSQRVFEILKEEGYEGGLTVLKDHVRSVRPKKIPRVSQPVEASLPGELAECDWSPFTVPFTEAPTKAFQVFGYMLRYSNRKYFGFYDTADLHALMDGHVQAFTTFKAVAKTCKYDGQKAVVLRWEGRQPIYNPRFIDFVTYYRFQAEACRPYHPNDKPSVERSFYELEKSFFNGRTFRDQDDLEAQLAHWQTTVCDVRIHRKTKRTALELFEEERPHLLPLPVHHYDTARVIYRVCDTEGYVWWRGNRYGVPTVHVTDLLPVRVTQSEILIYAIDLSCVARHELHPPGAGDDVPLPGRRPASRRGADLDQLRRAYQDLGEPAARFLQGVESAQPRSAAYHARLVLALRERFSTGDLVAAMSHAVQFGAFEHRAIERILVARCAPRGLDEYVAEATTRKLASVLGAADTAPRDLEEYDQLPCWPRPTTPTTEESCAKRTTKRSTTRTAVPGNKALRDRLRGHLVRLGLKDLEAGIDAYLDAAVKERPSYLQLFEKVLGDAAARHRERRIERRITGSGLKVRKSLTAFDWDFQPKLDRALVEDLATLRFVERREDILFTGKSGTGKSHILQAFVLKACEQELPVRYARCADLLDDLHAGLADGTYERRLKRWCRPVLLVIDDVGLGQVKKREDEPTAAHTLFNLLDRRHHEASTAVTSNIKLSAWGKYLGDATLAAAILDRLIMNATRIDIDGPSYRQHVARLRSKKSDSAD